MQKAVKRLGRGLSSLIPLPEEMSISEETGPPADAAGQPVAILIDVGQIRPNPFQPRKDIAPAQLQSLAESIRKSGVLQPIVVRRQVDSLYELVAGERRWRASQMAGCPHIPAVVREADDEEMLEIALVENIFREDLNAIDRAQAYRRYCEEFHLTAEDVAGRLGEDRTTVTNYLRLLDLPSEVKDWVAGGQLSMGHARCLLALRSPSELVRTAKQAIDQGLSVRAVEKLVRERVSVRVSASQPAAESGDAKRAQIRSVEQAFVQSLGTKVEIHESRRKGAGKIVIHYYSLDDFDRISEKLGVDQQ